MGIKCNTGVCLHMKGKWGLGAIFRNEKGDTMATYTQFIDGHDNLMLVEIMALNKALDIMKDCCFLENRFNIDN